MNMDTAFDSKANAPISPHVSSSSTAVFAHDAQPLLHKIDIRILPILAWLYLLLLMDRVNIGNAKILGLEASLNMKDGDYGITISLLLLAQILFMVPANLTMRKISPSLWLGGLCVCWGKDAEGLITLGTGFVKTFAGLCVCRFFLGMIEGAYHSGFLYFMSMYYKRYELQRRFNIVFCGAILAGAISGLFAYACAQLDGRAGLEGWRWIFIVEGLITIASGISTIFVLPDWPNDGNFLQGEEKILLDNRLNEDVQEAKMDRFDAAALKLILSDWKIYCSSIMFFFSANSGYSLVFFLPTVLRGLGWTANRAQVMTIPVYVTAMVVTLITAWISDGIQHRFSFVLIGVAFGIIGYSILLVPGLPYNIQYMAIYFSAAGFYVAQPLLLIWATNNWAGHYKRAVATALITGLGNCGGFISSNVYREEDAPRYQLGFGFTLAGVVVIGIAGVVFFFGLRAENRKRSRGSRLHLLDLPEHDRDNLGDAHPDFRFSY
ncbi:putative MFS transporter [Tothia fuscella]|uniref:MFS transporter n=1 Tax=Tothia fuscella TaxID=1048955 RepID=A0A9P4NK29_9PEZI|nr:putative MFS transporter [Tothia fuscella]